MNKPHPSYSLSECKTKASMLLKDLCRGDLEISQSAAKRFLRLPEFKNFTIDEIINSSVKRKHALTVIAMEKGFSSWSELKYQLPLIRGGFLNLWFASYDEAKTYQQENGGYLFPFKRQFFIVDADYVRNLGLDPTDSDWCLIQFDWIKPQDDAAWQRLYRKWMAVVEKYHG